MTNFVNLLNSVEKLAYEIIMWVIFVPKTILKVITNPDWVPGYIEGELKEEQEERFTDYMSPVVLLLAITLGMVAIITSINPSSLQISGPSQGVEDKSYEFEVMTTFMWENQDILSYSLYEYDNDKKDFMPFYLEDMCDFIQEEECRFDVNEESDIIYEYLSLGDEPGEYIVTFRFDEVGEHIFAIKVENTMGEIIRDEHSIKIHENTSLIDDASSSETQPKRKVTEMLGFIEIGEALTEENALVISLLALSFPLVFTFYIEAKNNTPIERKEFQPTFYIQCMHSSPVYLALLLLIISYLYQTTGRVVAFGGLNLPVYLFRLSLSL
jgi:hypothetical protein